MTQPPGDDAQPGDPNQQPGPPYGQGPGQGQPPGYGAPGYGAPGYGAPGYGPPADPGPPGYYTGPPATRSPDHPAATKALVLGLIAVIGGFACYLPVLLGPWAWVVGRRAVKEIDAQPGRFEGRGQAMAGYVLGVVATVLLVLALLALVGLILFLVASEEWGGPGPGPGPGLA